MAWTKPTAELDGCDEYDLVRATVEIMYAINEREEFAGLSMTEWKKSEFATYPDVWVTVTKPTIDDFDGVSLARTMWFNNYESIFSAISRLADDGGFMTDGWESYSITSGDFTRLLAAIGTKYEPLYVERTLPVLPGTYPFDTTTDRVQSFDSVQISAPTEWGVVVDSVSTDFDYEGYQSVIISGGTTITIAGSGLAAVNTVYVYGREATITSQTDTEIVATSPRIDIDGMLAIGTDQILTLVLPAYISFDVPFLDESEHPFWIAWDDKPYITAYRRNIIQEGTPQNIWIYGLNLTDSTVTIGGVTCPVTYIDPLGTEMRCTTPTIPGGLQDLIVTTAEGMATIPDAVHVVDEDNPIEALAVTSVSPSTEQYGVPSLLVEVTGTGFYSYFDAAGQCLVNGFVGTTLFVTPHKMYVEFDQYPSRSARSYLFNEYLFNEVPYPFPSFPMTDANHIREARQLLEELTTYQKTIDLTDQSSEFRYAQGPEEGGFHVYPSDIYWENSSDMWADVWADAIAQTPTAFDPETGIPIPVPDTHAYDKERLRWLLTIQYYSYTDEGGWGTTALPWVSIVGPKLNYHLDLSAIDAGTTVAKVRATYNAGWVADCPGGVGHGGAQNTPTTDIVCEDSFGNEIVIDHTSEGLPNTIIEFETADLVCGESNECWFSIGDPDGAPETIPFTIIEEDYGHDVRASIRLTNVEVLLDCTGSLTYG